MISATEIIEFWYSEPMSKHWFKSTKEIDLLIKDKYMHAWEQAVQGGLDHWQENAEDCLALILLCDQFPLNMFRGEGKCFLSEAKSIELCLLGIDRGYDKQLRKEQLNFFYMPLMHSENLDHQKLSVEMFEKAGLKDNARFALHHLNIVERFGRFPHRNIMLGRESTLEEVQYLNSKQAFNG